MGFFPACEDDYFSFTLVDTLQKWKASLIFIINNSTVILSGIQEFCLF